MHTVNNQPNGIPLLGAGNPNAMQNLAWLDENGNVKTVNSNGGLLGSGNPNALQNLAWLDANGNVKTVKSNGGLLGSSMQPRVAARPLMNLEA